MPVSKNRRKNTKKPAIKVLQKKKPTADVSQDIPDRKFMEKMMAQITNAAFAPDPFAGDGLLEAPDHQDPLRQAQDMMYDPWEADTKRERIALARQALKISDLCADAYLLLAEEEAKDIIQARKYYEQAVDAGRQALGDALFEDAEGDFWLVLETRPFHACQGGIGTNPMGLG